MVPTIDLVKTGENIKYLRVKNKLSIPKLQKILGFNNPTSIYKWEKGYCLPCIDNLVILADLFNVTIDDIIIINKNT